MTRRPKTLIQHIACLVQARKTCRARYDADNANAGALEWFDRHTDRLNALARDFLAHGGGFDQGSSIDLDKSTEAKIIIETAFHHMSEHGYYNGWTNHSIVVTPSFAGFDLKVGGRNRSDIKDYIASVFDSDLSQPFIETEAGFERVERAA